MKKFLNLLNLFLAGVGIGTIYVFATGDTKYVIIPCVLGFVYGFTHQLYFTRNNLTS